MAWKALKKYQFKAKIKTVYWYLEEETTTKNNGLEGVVNQLESRAVTDY